MMIGKMACEFWSPEYQLGDGECGCIVLSCWVKTFWTVFETESARMVQAWANQVDISFQGSLGSRVQRAWGASLLVIGTFSCWARTHLFASVNNLWRLSRALSVFAKQITLLSNWSFSWHDPCHLSSNLASSVVSHSLSLSVSLHEKSFNVER